ncbi:MAG: hypothetical protein OXI16_13905 [Chloroflexota bacterium]|nr:hypothetical protein [Chloroflexota bacterium]
MLQSNGRDGFTRTAYILVYAMIMAGWLGFTAFAEWSAGNMGSLYEAAKVIFDEAADKWGLVWTVTIGLNEGGLTGMVMGAFEKHVFGPRREAIEKARQAEKRAEQAEQDYAELRAWTERRLAAEGRGEPFDEPIPPTTKWTPER